jgi:hypothetical protein
MLNLPLLNTSILNLLAGWIEKRIRELSFEAGMPTYELRIQVDDGRFELDGSGVRDRDLGAIPLADGWAIVLLLEFDTVRGRWRGPFIDEAAQRVVIDRDGRGPLPDRRFCSIALPTPDQCRPARWCPNPTFIVKLMPDDHGRDLDAGRWKTVAQGVTALEDQLTI